MSIVKGEWADIRVIASEAAQKERELDDKRIPQHPRTELLEQDLMRAIRILNEAGFTVVREIPETLRVEISTIVDCPKDMTKDVLINLLKGISWSGGEKIFKSDISAKIIR